MNGLGTCYESWVGHFHEYPLHTLCLCGSERLSCPVWRYSDLSNRLAKALAVAAHIGEQYLPVPVTMAAWLRWHLIIAGLHSELVGPPSLAILASSARQSGR